jgi:hypothetical protein
VGADGTDREYLTAAVNQEHGFAPCVPEQHGSVRMFDSSSPCVRSDRRALSFIRSSAISDTHAARRHRAWCRRIIEVWRGSAVMNKSTSPARRPSHKAPP